MGQAHEGGDAAEAGRDESGNGLVEVDAARHDFPQVILALS
jgi:hypothetical protein